MLVFIAYTSVEKECTTTLYLLSETFKKRKMQSGKFEFLSHYLFLSEEILLQLAWHSNYDK